MADQETQPEGEQPKAAPPEQPAAPSSSPATPPAQTGPRLRGIAVGCTRTLPLYGESRARRTDESEAVYKALDRQWRALRAVEVTVRRQTRRKVQLAALQVEAARAKAAALFDSRDPASMDAATRANDELRGLLRNFLAEPVTDPVSGKELGPVLIAVRGADYERPDGSVQALDELADIERLLAVLEDMELLESVGSVALQAQEPTRAQGN